MARLIGDDRGNDSNNNVINLKLECRLKNKNYRFKFVKLNQCHKMFIRRERFKE